MTTSSRVPRAAIVSLSLLVLVGIYALGQSPLSKQDKPQSLQQVTLLDTRPARIRNKQTLELGLDLNFKADTTANTTVVTVANIVTEFKPGKTSALPPPLVGTVEPPQIFAGTSKSLEIKAIGCTIPKSRAQRMTDSGTANACSELCHREGYLFVAWYSNMKCYCADATGDFDMSKIESNCLSNRLAEAYQITTPALEIIDLYIAPAKRTSSMFTSGRLAQYYSGKYAYRRKNLNAQVFKSEQHFSELTCSSRKKIFVQIVGAVTWLLQHWPDNSVLIMTADEIGNWGLGRDDRRFGPHGPGREFSTNESSEYKHIMLPQEVFPMYRQYYHYRQIAAFGSDAMRFVPLGSRNEFPDIARASIIPAPNRRFVYSYMASITDGTRAKVHKILLSDNTTFNETQRFIQVSQNWHSNANNAEYVAPMQYSEVMMQSVFAICPKGHSVEQFRIYEAIESGSIPVMDLKDGYLAQHLPPAYLESPMLLLSDGWDSVIHEMQTLWNDPKALLERQQKLLVWYEKYMRDMMLEIETLLEARKGHSTPFCQNASTSV